MMMERKCSYCGNFGHNSRTCNNNSHHIIDGIINIGGGVKLFGVQLELSSCSCSSSSSSTSSSTSLSTQFASMKRSFSLDYLLSSSSSSPNFELIAKDEKNSDKTCLNNSTSQRRKKGVPWSEEEHRAFLEGLEKLGKGDWRGISRGFVTTRTPSQVASHAQKYFLRQNCFNRRKRRPSLLDVGKEEFTIEPFNNRYLKGSDELAYCGQIGWPSTNYLIPNKNKFCVHHQWFSYHHSVLNWPFISSTNHTTIIQSSEEEAPHLDLKLSLH